MVICKECNREFESLDSLRRHSSQKHKINAEQIYIMYQLSGMTPTCKCGCGEPTKFLSIEKGFVDYKLGHAARINNNWGHNPDAIRKSHETQAKMYKSGELIIWNKGLTIEDPRVKDNVDKVMANPNRGNNISKSLTGVLKSDEHKEKLKQSQIKSWSNPIKREKQSIKTIDRLIKNNYRNKKSKLESKFELILNLLGVEFIYQYRVESGMFDFFIENKNILIEVDGDFHHSNPNSKHYNLNYPIQIKTMNNDIRKNKIAEDNNIKLLRFWEFDINNKPEEVIIRLRAELGI